MILKDRSCICRCFAKQAQCLLGSGRSRLSGDLSIR